jgi:hypothetical protein
MLDDLCFTSSLEAAMWYYEVNHQPVGPVSQEDIAGLLRAGKIDALTLVWQEGFTDWKHLGETEFGELSRNITPAAPVIIPGMPQQSGYPSVYPGTAQTTVITPTPRVKPRRLKNIFTWWAVSMAFVAVYQILSGLFPENTVIISLACLAEAVVIYYTIMQFVLLFQLWKIDQDGSAGTTPGRAVGFLFIPFFQIYWIFRAYTGLSLDQNRYIKTHFENQPALTPRKAHPIFSLLLFAVSLVGGLYVYIPLFNKLYASNMTTFDITTYNTILTQFNIPLTIFSVVTMIFTFFMFLDFYLTAKSIIEAETK